MTFRFLECHAIHDLKVREASISQGTLPPWNRGNVTKTVTLPLSGAVFVNIKMAFGN
jgi:hypothetical protein